MRQTGAAVLATLTILVVVGVWAVLRAGNRRFWRVVAAIPDVAYDWFTSQDCWVVEVSDDRNQGASRSDFVGPFALWVPKLGRAVRVYCHRDAVEQSQARFLEKYAQEVERMLWIVRLARVWAAVRVVLFLGILYLAWNIPSPWLRGFSIYVLIGAVVALRHLASGRQGSLGPAVTFVCGAILWPLLLVAKARR